MKKNTENRFWEKVYCSKGKSSCWLWTAGRDIGGYGRFWWERKSVRAHRVSWGIAHGKPPGDSCVLHTCDNPPCVNPAHLFLGTRKDNMWDMTAKGRQAVGERVGAAKLTEDQVLDIYGDSRSLREIASDHNIGLTTVHCIKRGKTWAHVTQYRRKA